MRIIATTLLLLASLSSSLAQQVDEGWQWADPVRVQYPANVFPLSLGKTERYEGRKFGSADGHSTLAIYSFPNDRQESPARYLKRTLVVDPNSVVYRRITPRFFVLSNIRNEKIYYSRCNFGRFVRCIYLEYPADEKRKWDRAVTRISHSLQ